MAHDGSAYAALGLQPGADATAIERAYKSLIKQHHPDREGGTPLEPRKSTARTVSFAQCSGRRMRCFHRDRAAGGKRRVGAGGDRAAARVGQYCWRSTGPSARSCVSWRGRCAEAGWRRCAVDSDGDGRDEPAAPPRRRQGGGRQAVAMLGKRDDLALSARAANATARCGSSRASPSSTAARRSTTQWSSSRTATRCGTTARSARSQSPAASGARHRHCPNDYLAIDSRLDRIRIQVELALAPPDPPRLHRRCRETGGQFGGCARRKCRRSAGAGRRHQRD